MSTETIHGLGELARADPAVAPLARLYAEALRAGAGRGWNDPLPVFRSDRLDHGLPYLHHQTLTVDAEEARRFLLRLAAVAEQAGRTGALGDLQRALTEGGISPLELIEASVAQDVGRFQTLAASVDGDPSLLATLAGLAALPLLQACGRKAAPLVERAMWPEGYCPICAAWAVLAEVRGLDKRRWLRCNRCGSAWEVAQDGCIYCGERDWRNLGYLAAEGDTESRRAATCRTCHGYLKTLASLTPIAATDVAISDMRSVELDMAALEYGYRRPDLPGFPLAVHVEPAQRRRLWNRR